MARSTNLVHLPRTAARADAPCYDRSAWVAIGVAWAIAILRLGIAIARKEHDVDFVLALLFVACLPAWAVVRAWSRRPLHRPDSAGPVATVIPLRPHAGRRPPTDRGALRRGAS